MKNLLAATAIGVMAFAASTLSAQACNPLLNKNFGKHVEIAKLPISMLATAPASDRAGSIVGLWHVVHTASNGTLFLESYDQWNADGGEFELGNLPPATGALCIGTWTPTYKGKAKLLIHVTWLYDTSNNWVGTLKMTQTNTLHGVNNYTGTFDAKFFDTSGNMFMDVNGTTQAERLAKQ